MTYTNFITDFSKYFNIDDLKDSYSWGYVVKVEYRPYI